MVTGVVPASVATPTHAVADGQLIPVILVSDDPATALHVTPPSLVATGPALPPALQSYTEPQATSRK